MNNREEHRPLNHYLPINAELSTPGVELPANNVATASSIPVTDIPLQYNNLAVDHNHAYQMMLQSVQFGGGPVPTFAPHFSPYAGNLYPQAIPHVLSDTSAAVPPVFSFAPRPMLVPLNVAHAAQSATIHTDIATTQPPGPQPQFGMQPQVWVHNAPPPLRAVGVPSLEAVSPANTLAHAHPPHAQWTPDPAALSYMFAQQLPENVLSLLPPEALTQVHALRHMYAHTNMASHMHVQPQVPGSHAWMAVGSAADVGGPVMAAAGGDNVAEAPSAVPPQATTGMHAGAPDTVAANTPAMADIIAHTSTDVDAEAQAVQSPLGAAVVRGPLGQLTFHESFPAAPAAPASTEPANDTARYGLHLRGVSALPARLHAQHGELMQVAAGAGTATGAADVDGHRLRSACAAEVEDYMFAARAGHVPLATSLLREVPSLATLTASAPAVAGAEVVFLSSGLALQPDVVVTKHSVNVHALGVNRGPTPAQDPLARPAGVLEGVMGPPLPHSRDTDADADSDAAVATEDSSLAGPQPTRLPNDLGAAAVAHAAYVGPGSYAGYGGAQAPDAMAAFLRGVDLHAHMAAYRFPLESALDQPPQPPLPQPPTPASPFELVAGEEDTPDENIMRRADTPPAPSAPCRTPARTAFAEKCARMHAFPRVIGAAPLHWAVDGGHTRVVRALLQRGADPNQVRPDLHSPLMVAVVNGHTACAALLLQYGADADYRHPRSGVTALQLAVSFNKPLVVQLLLSAVDGMFGLHAPQDEDDPLCGAHTRPPHRRKRPASEHAPTQPAPAARAPSSKGQLDGVSERGDVDGCAQASEVGGAEVAQQARALAVEGGGAEATREEQTEEHIVAGGGPAALSGDPRAGREAQQPCGEEKGEGEGEGEGKRNGDRAVANDPEMGVGVDVGLQKGKTLEDKAEAGTAPTCGAPDAETGMEREANGEDEPLPLKPPLLLHLEHGVDAQQLSLHPHFNTKRELWRLGLPEEGEAAEEEEGDGEGEGEEDEDEDDEEDGEGDVLLEGEEGGRGEEAWLLEGVEGQRPSARLSLEDEQRGRGEMDQERRGGQEWSAELRVTEDGYLEVTLPTRGDPCEAAVEAELAAGRRAHARAATVLQRARERWRRRQERVRAVLRRTADCGPLRWLAVLVRTRSRASYWDAPSSGRVHGHLRDDTLRREDAAPLHAADGADAGAEACPVRWGRGRGAGAKDEKGNVRVEAAERCELESVARTVDVERSAEGAGSGVAEELAYTQTPALHAADMYQHADVEAEAEVETEAGLAAEVLAEAAAWGAPSLCVQEEVLNGDYAYYTAPLAATDAAPAMQAQTQAQPEAATARAAVDLEPNYRLCEACCAELGVDVNCAGYAHYFCFTDETVPRGAVQVLAHAHANADGAAASTAAHAQPPAAGVSFTLVVPPVPSQDDFIDSDDEEVDPPWARREDPARGRPPPMPEMGASSLQTRQRFERSIDEHANASFSPFGSRQRGTRKPNAAARMQAPSPTAPAPTPPPPPRCPVVSRLTGDAAELLELHADTYSPYAALVRFFRGTLPVTTHPFALMGFADDAGTCVRCCASIAASGTIGPARGVSSHKLAAAMEDLWECVAPWVERVRYKQSVAELMLPQLGMRPLVNGLLGLPDHRHLGLCDDFLCSELFAAFLEQMGWVEHHDRRSFLRTLRAQPDSLMFSALRYVTLLTTGERYSGYLDLEQYHALAAGVPRRLFEVLHTPAAELLGAEVALATHTVLLPGQSAEEYLQQQQRQAVPSASNGSDKDGDVCGGSTWLEQLMSEAARAVASPPYLTPLPHGPAGHPVFYPSGPPRSLRALVLPPRVAAAAAAARVRRRRREWRRAQARALRKARARGKRVRICDDAEHIEPDDTRTHTSTNTASPHAWPCAPKSALAAPRTRAGGDTSEGARVWSVAHAAGAEEGEEEEMAELQLLQSKQARRYLRMRSGSRHGGAYGYGYDYGFFNHAARAPCPRHGHNGVTADVASTAADTDAAVASDTLCVSAHPHSAAPTALPGPALSMAYTATSTKMSNALAAAAFTPAADTQAAAPPTAASEPAKAVALCSATTDSVPLEPVRPQPTATFRSLTPGQSVRTARATRAAAARKGTVRAYRSEDAGRYVPVVDAIGEEDELQADDASGYTSMGRDDAFVDPPLSARASAANGGEDERAHAMARYGVRRAAVESHAGGEEGSAVGVGEHNGDTAVAAAGDAGPEKLRKSSSVYVEGAEAQYLVYSDALEGRDEDDEDVEVEEVEVESGEFDQLSGEVHMHPDGYEYVYVDEVVHHAGDARTANAGRARYGHNGHVDGDGEPSGGRSIVEDYSDDADVYGSGDDEDDEDIFEDEYENDNEDEDGDEDREDEEDEDVSAEAGGGLRGYVSFEAVDADGAHVYSDVIGGLEGRGDTGVLVTIDGNVVYTQRKTRPRTHKPRRRRKRATPAAPQPPLPEPEPEPESREDVEAEVRAAVAAASQLPPRPADDLSGYWSVLDKGCARYDAAVAEARVRTGHQHARGDTTDPCTCVATLVEPAEPVGATGEAATHCQGAAFDAASTLSACGAGRSPPGGGGCPGLPQLAGWTPRPSAWAVQSAHVLVSDAPNPNDAVRADECTCEAMPEHGGPASSSSHSAANAAAVREAFRDAVVYSLEDHSDRDAEDTDAKKAAAVDTEGADGQHSTEPALSAAEREIAARVSTTAPTSLAAAAAAVPALPASSPSPPRRTRRSRRSHRHARLRHYLQQHTRARRQTRAAARRAVQADMVCVSASVGPHGPTPGMSRRFVPVAGLPDLDKARVLYQRYWNLFQCQRLLVLMETMHAQYAADRSLAACLARNDHGLSAADLATVCATEYPLVLHAMLGYHVRRTLQALLEPLIPRVPATHLAFGAARRKLVYVFCCGCIVEHPRVHPRQRARARHAHVLPGHSHADPRSPHSYRTHASHTGLAAMEDGVDARTAPGGWVNAEEDCDCIEGCDCMDWAHEHDCGGEAAEVLVGHSDTEDEVGVGVGVGVSESAWPRSQHYSAVDHSADFPPQPAVPYYNHLTNPDQRAAQPSPALPLQRPLWPEWPPVKASPPSTMGVEATQTEYFWWQCLQQAWSQQLQQAVATAGEPPLAHGHVAQAWERECTPGDVPQPSWDNVSSAIALSSGECFDGIIAPFTVALPPVVWRDTIAAAYSSAFALISRGSGAQVAAQLAGGHERASLIPHDGAQAMRAPDLADGLTGNEATAAHSPHDYSLLSSHTDTHVEVWDTPTGLAATHDGVCETHEDEHDELQQQLQYLHFSLLLTSLVHTCVAAKINPQVALSTLNALPEPAVDEVPALTRDTASAGPRAHLPDDADTQCSVSELSADHAQLQPPPPDLAEFEQHLHQLTQCWCWLHAQGLRLPAAPSQLCELQAYFEQQYLLQYSHSTHATAVDSPQEPPAPEPMHPPPPPVEDPLQLLCPAGAHNRPPRVARTLKESLCQRRVTTVPARDTLDALEALRTMDVRAIDTSGCKCYSLLCASSLLSDAAAALDTLFVAADHAAAAVAAKKVEVEAAEACAATVAAAEAASVATADTKTELATAVCDTPLLSRTASRAELVVIVEDSASTSRSSHDLSVDAAFEAARGAPASEVELASLQADASVTDPLATQDFPSTDASDAALVDHSRPALGAMPAGAADAEASVSKPSMGRALCAPTEALDGFTMENVRCTDAPTRESHEEPNRALRLAAELAALQEEMVAAQSAAAHAEARLMQISPHEHACVPQALYLPLPPREEEVMVPLTTSDLIVELVLSYLIPPAALEELHGLHPHLSSTATDALSAKTHELDENAYLELSASVFQKDAFPHEPADLFHEQWEDSDAALREESEGARDGAPWMEWSVEDEDVEDESQLRLDDYDAKDEDQSAYAYEGVSAHMDAFALGDLEGDDDYQYSWRGEGEGEGEYEEDGYYLDEDMYEGDADMFLYDSSQFGEGDDAGAEDIFDDTDTGSLFDVADHIPEEMHVSRTTPAHDQRLDLYSIQNAR